MLGAVASVRAQPPAGALPKELEIVVNDMIAAACPTHMLAVYSKSAAQTCRVTLFPTHDLVLAAHCSNVSFPHCKPDVTKPTVRLPVVPICLPSPETFSILQSYLYTKRTDALLASLLPTPPASLSDPAIPLSEMITQLTQHLASSSSLPSLASHSMIINGVWRNACALAVRDDKLWDAIDVSWQVVVGAMSIMNGQSC